jgi:hypothetical protein
LWPVFVLSLHLWDIPQRRYGPVFVLSLHLWDIPPEVLSAFCLHWCVIYVTTLMPHVSQETLGGIVRSDIVQASLIP